MLSNSYNMLIPDAICISTCPLNTKSIDYKAYNGINLTLGHISGI